MPLAWPLTTTRVPFRAQTQAGSRRVLGFAGNRRRFFRRDFSLFRESACFRAPASVCQRCLGCVAADARHRFERMNWTARSTRNSPKTAREAPLPSGSCISQSCHRAFKVRCAFHSCRPAAAGEYRLSTQSGLNAVPIARRKVVIGEASAAIGVVEAPDAVSNEGRRTRRPQHLTISTAPACPPCRPCPNAPRSSHLRRERCRRT